MPSQVIKAMNGKMETLMDSGPVDLASMGDISVRRSSEILFDEAEQKFYIRFLEPALTFLNEEIRTEFYATYKLAVESEIAQINSYRMLGIL